MAESLHHDENRLPTRALCPRPIHSVVKALVGEPAHEPHNATCKEASQEAKVVGAVQKRLLKLVNKKGMQQDRDYTPERQAKRRLPVRSERHLAEFAPDPALG